MDLRKSLAALDRFQHDRPWLAFPIAVVKRFRDDEASSLAALIAYYGFFSLFPLLLVLTSVAGWVLGSDPALRDRLVGSALSQFPIIGSRIGSSVRSLRGSPAAVIVGVVGAMWSGLAGVSTAQDALDDVWEVPRRVRASFLRSRLRGLLMLLFLGSFVVVITAVSATASALGTGWLARIAIASSSVVLNAVAVAIAYRILTSVDLSVADVAPGALFAGIAWTILQGIGGWLVETRIRGAGDLYGFFAVVMGLLAWIYLAAQVFLIGAVVCVVRARRLWPRRLSSPPPSPPTAPEDRRTTIEKGDEPVDRHLKRSMSGARLRGVPQAGAERLVPRPGPWSTPDPNPARTPLPGPVPPIPHPPEPIPDPPRPPDDPPVPRVQKTPATRLPRARA